MRSKLSEGVHRDRTGRGPLGPLRPIRTRPIALILSGQMAVAYWLFHFAGGLNQPRGVFPVVNGGDAAILFFFVFLWLSVAGPGRFAMRQERTTQSKQS